MDLTSQVNKILQEYVDDVDKVVLRAEEKVAKEAVNKLKKTSPKNPKGNGKHYANDWKVDQRSRKRYAHLIVHNKQYQLTHLLENGHDIVRNGRVVGHAKAHKHIKPVEEWVKKEVEAEIRRELR